MGVTVKVQQIEQDSNKLSKRDLYARVAFYYPQYTLKQVQKLPSRDVKLLLTTANKIEAARMYNLTSIAAAPHSKKGKNVTSLLNHFKSIVNDKK